MDERVGVVDAALSAHRVVVPVVLEWFALIVRFPWRTITCPVRVITPLAPTILSPVRLTGPPAGSISGRPQAGGAWSRSGAFAGGVAGVGLDWGVGGSSARSEWGEAAEQQQGGPEWFPTTAWGRHYNGQCL